MFHDKQMFLTQTREHRSLYFAISDRDVLELDHAAKQALSYGAARIYVVLLSFAGSEPKTCYLMTRYIKNDQFSDWVQYAAEYKTLLGPCESGSYKKQLLAGKESFAIGHHKNFQLFKKAFAKRSGQLFEEKETAALATFLARASQHTQEAFQFNRLSNASGPVALFWAWHYGPKPKLELKGFPAEGDFPKRLLDRLALLDTAFVYLTGASAGFTEMFSQKDQRGEYLLKRCYVLKDICQRPVCGHLTSRVSEMEAYFEQALLVAVREVMQDAHQFRECQLGAYRLKVFHDMSMPPAEYLANINAHEQIKIALTAFKERFSVLLLSIQKRLTAKSALQLKDLYYSIFEYFGYSHDLIEKGKLVTMLPEICISPGAIQKFRRLDPPPGYHCVIL